MKIGTLVRHRSTTVSHFGIGIVVKVHEMLDYNGHTRVDVHWLDLGIRTETVRILREVVCE